MKKPEWVVILHELLSDMKSIYRKVIPKSMRHRLRTLIRLMRIGAYRADMTIMPTKTIYFCPCCGFHVRSFVAGGYQKHPEIYDPSRYEHIRQDVLCPVCFALPRHRILASWCDVHKDYLQLARILYFAPEMSIMRWMQRNGIRCTTADLYAEAELKLDIQDTGLPEESYDVIVCNHVLEHVEDFRKALNELYRILRPHGCLICSFPMDPKIDLLDETKEELSKEERVQRFGQFDHLRVFGMKAESFLTEAGFSVERISGEDYSEEILPVVGPADYDMNCLFVCWKS